MLGSISMHVPEKSICDQEGNLTTGLQTNLVEFACEYLVFADNEGSLVLSPHCLEDGNDFVEEVRGDPYCE